MKKIIDYFIVTCIIVLFFCISTSIKVWKITHPILVALFFAVVFLYLILTKRIKLSDFKKKSFEN